MPASAKVFVRHGPYEACGIVDHRESRLQGLQTILQKDGHTVELVKIADWNCVELLVNGEKVFNCQIQELDYGGDGELDRHCIDARQAVKKAY